MPVSSPSYFPPNRSTGTIVGLTAGNNTTGSRNFLAGKAAGLGSTISDLIIIGDEAGAAGLTDANLAGSVLIGSNAGHSLINTTSDPAEGVTFIGFNAGAALPHSGGSTLVGWNVVPSAVSDNTGAVGRNLTALGSNIALTGSWGTLHESVLIGTDVATTPSGGGFSTLTACVIIGHAAGNLGPGVPGYNQSVIIGDSAASNCTRLTNCTIIGSGTGSTGPAMTNMVIVGDSIGLPGSPNGCVLLGSQIGINGGNNVFIGWGANHLAVNAYNNAFLVEVAINGLSSPPSALVYGQFDSGCVVLGNSSQSTNRDFGNGATNALKLISGSKGPSTPLGGGYFYIDGANNTDMPAHWVDATGADGSLTGSGYQLVGTGKGVITPATLPAGNTDQYNPAGLGQAQVVRISGNAGGSTLKGLATNGFAGQLLTLLNVGANTITIAHNGSISANNNISLPGAVNLNLPPFSSLRLWWDVTLGNWIALARSN